MSYRKATVAALTALVLIGISIARADYAIKDGNGTLQTVFAFVCNATKICSAQVLIDSTGTEKATAGNPLRVDPTGTTTQPVNCVSGCSQVVPATGTFTNRSSSITTGGTSQQLAASNSLRKRIIIENPSSIGGQGIAAVESLYINFTSAAGVNNGTSIELVPGGSFDTGAGPVTTEAVNVNAATTGHLFIAKEM